MKIHKRFDHRLKGIGYWGEPEKISHRLNFGVFEAGETFPEDPLHYHTERTTFFCVLKGLMNVEVEGETIAITPEQALEIAPNEKYRVLNIGADGCTYIVVGDSVKFDRFEV